MHNRIGNICYTEVLYAAEVMAETSTERCIHCIVNNSTQLITQIKTSSFQQQEAVENENFDNLRELERQLTAEKIECQNLKSLNTNLEEKIAEYAETISKQEQTIQQLRYCN